MGRTGRSGLRCGLQTKGSLVRDLPGVAVRCGLEQVTFTPCLVPVKPRKPWAYD